MDNRDRLHSLSYFENNETSDGAMGYMQHHGYKDDHVLLYLLNATYYNIN